MVWVCGGRGVEQERICKCGHFLIDIPKRIPPGTNGLVSPGTAFLLQVISHISITFSALAPSIPFDRKSTKIKCVSVPPETIWYPRDVSSSARALQLATTCLWYAANSSVQAYHLSVMKQLVNKHYTKATQHQQLRKYTETVVTKTAYLFQSHTDGSNLVVVWTTLECRKYSKVHFTFQIIGSLPNQL